MSDTTPASVHTATPGGLGEAAEAVQMPAGGLAPEFPQDTRKTIILVLVAAVGMYLMMLSLGTALQLRIASVDPSKKEATYSSAASISALLMLVLVPLGGALSDRTTSRFGRRRPWIVGCLVPTLVCMAAIGLTRSLAVMVVAYIIGIALAQVGFNAYAVIPVEGVPENRRGSVMGFMGMCGALAMSGGSYLAGSLVNAPVLMMTVPVLAALGLSLPLLALYADPQKDAVDVPPLSLKGLFAGFLVNPKKHPDFAWAWASRFLAGVAMAAMFTYFVFYLMDGLHVPLPEIGAKAGLLSLASAPVSIFFFTFSGWLSDKVGRRKPFVMAAALFMAAALVIGGQAKTFNAFLVAWLLFAVGQAMYLTVDLALCAAVLPDMADAGKDMAVFALALNIPNIIVPAVAPMILASGGGHNYRLLWLIAAVLCAIGGLIVNFIRGTR